MVSILSCSRTGGMGRRIAPRGMTWVVEIFRDWREPDIEYCGVGAWGGGCLGLIASENLEI